MSWLGLSDAALSVLHNAQPGANRYPLCVSDGLFFSEATGPRNEQADDYHALISKTLSLITRCLAPDGRMDFARVAGVGAEIQKLDAAFARTKINQPQDAIHRCYGPGPRHPYSKITLCRTIVPVGLGDELVPFIYEKFLVAYSYFDGAIRKSTATPLHTHPLNFETVYFVGYGPNSYVTEQEYRIVSKDGGVLIREDGTVDTELLHHFASRDFRDVIFKRGETHYIRATEEPTILPPFDFDPPLAEAGLIRHTDGLFRPHQVIVHDDREADRETLYYAIDNYFGPTGRVIIYDQEGGPNLWRHDDWER